MDWDTAATAVLSAALGGGAGAAIQAWAARRVHDATAVATDRSSKSAMYLAAQESLERALATLERQNEAQAQRIDRMDGRLLKAEASLLVKDMEIAGLRQTNRDLREELDSVHAQLANVCAELAARDAEIQQLKAGT
jgi:septal ring factor EnvC (AmiA/AmiB activator)